MRNFSSLSIQNLMLLEALAQRGVLHKAGEAINLSPSAASRMLTKIQQILGQRCFVLAGSRYEPTDYYQTIAPHIRAALARLEQLEAQNFDPSRCSRTFRISSMMAEISHVIGGVLPSLLAQAPNARVDLKKMDNEFAAVLNGDVDFAVVTAVDLPPDVHMLKLYPLDRVVLLRQGHPLLAHSEPITMATLRTCDRVSIRTGRSQSWTSPDQSLFTNERFLGKTRFSTSRFNTAWEAMEKTDLIAVCGWRAAEIAMRSHALTAIPLPLDANEPLYWNGLIWGPCRHHDEACRWVRGLFAQWAKAEEARVRALFEAGRWIPRREPEKHPH